MTGSVHPSYIKLIGQLLLLVCAWRYVTAAAQQRLHLQCYILQITKCCRPAFLALGLHVMYDSLVKSKSCYHPCACWGMCPIKATAQSHNDSLGSADCEALWRFIRTPSFIGVTRFPKEWKRQ
jgi:hypothetical protein